MPGHRVGVDDRETGGSGKRSLPTVCPIRHRQSLRPCRCHPEIVHMAGTGSGAREGACQ